MEHTNFRVSLAKVIMKRTITSKPDKPEKLLGIFPSWKNLGWGTVSVTTSPEYSKDANKMLDIQQEDRYTLLAFFSYLFIMIIKPVRQCKELYSLCHSFPIVSSHSWHWHCLVWRCFWSLILANIADAYLSRLRFPGKKCAPYKVILESKYLQIKHCILLD